MRRQELEILNDITKIQRNQTILLQKTRTPQSQFLQAFAQRYLINKKIVHKNIQNALEFLEGSFANISLIDSYLNFALDNRVDLSPDDFRILKMLISWTDYFPSLKSSQSIQLIEAVFQGGDVNVFNSLEQLISYLNFIIPDLLKLFKKKDQSENSKISEVQKYNFNKLQPEQILSFLNVTLPKVLLNVLLPNQTLPNQLKKDHQSYECLYKNSSQQYFVRSKQNYSSFIRVLIRGILNMDLKSSQQKALMQIVFRYFYAFHYDKKQAATDIFVQAYNKLDESTRFALADQFILFFRIIRKIGKGKFADFLAQKSPWIRQVTGKVGQRSLIGYQKDSVKPFNPIDLMDNFVVESGKKALRTFQILEDYSLFYFKIDVVALDITIRLYYLGEIDAQKPTEALLIQQQKRSGQFKSSIMAARRGIYVFEFDNSYSWINSKSIRYENIILAPLQIKSNDQPKWLSSYFNNVPTNSALPEKVTSIQRIVEKKPQKKYAGQAAITKNGPFYNLKITKQNQVYEFQSQNEEVFVKKFNQLVETAQNIKWTLNGQPLEDSDDLHNILGQQKPPKKRKANKEEEKEEKKQKIQINFEDYKDEE